MWSQAGRSRIADFERRARRYPTDLTDEEWALIVSFLPPVATRGRKPATDLCDIFDALRYLARTGGGWRMLPNDFPPWQTVDWWFRRFVRQLLFHTIHVVALMLDRDRQAREQSPCAAVVDSQSIEAPMAQKRGYDAGKKVLGRKQHIAVDTDGRLLMVNLTTADISDSTGALAIVAAIRKHWPWLKQLFADGVYQDFVLEIVRRTDKEAGFKVLPKRWVVERAFGWMTRWRRLVRD